ncbi:hypothetical protein BHE74_00040998 [Ensete ventricosum]|nr:hypothetical protein GW17_00024647 [Ensete ventricosum]RWW52572.1 hypothetical protein BHE74_00040998 [Ensete ventricosum]
MCVPDSNYTNNRRVQTLKLSRIERRLDKINKPAVRTIERPRFKGDRTPINYNASDATRRAWQAWHHVGHCPKGTVPIRRSSVDDVLRAKSLFHFGKKHLGGVPLARKVDAPDVVSGNGHEVSPELYGDSRPRLFTYWTVTISPVSSSGNNQYDITILIWKDPIAGNWWMSLGDSSTLVGYWPAELFTHLSDRATMVEWGGEVVNTRPHGEHTSTQMGSGRFAEEGFGRASYFRSLEVVDSDNSLTSARPIATMAENTKCYDIKSFSNADWGTYFYYGGPGNNPHCP